MSTRIDLNSDVGESFGAYKIGLDEEVVPLISSANVACGFHAGDPAVMRRTIALAAAGKAAVGAHPGLPDLMGFGRRMMDVSLQEIKDYVTYQIGALSAVAAAQKLVLQHVKPHGALYNMAVRRPEIWEAVAQAMAAVDPNLILFALAGLDQTGLKYMGDRYGIRVAFEFFGDRAYNSDGSLVSRKLPGAVIHDKDQVAEKIIQLIKTGTVTCIDGSEIALKADTICVHGDNPSALDLIRNIRRALNFAGIEIAPVGDFLK